MGLDNIDEKLSGNHSLHLMQKSLPLVTQPRSAYGRCKDALPGRALLIVTESELLAAHELSYCCDQKVILALISWGIQSFPKSYHP